MTAVSCPFCGTTMNLPLKFCLACGHAVSTSDVQRLGGMKNQLKPGITKRIIDTISGASFDRAKRSYSFQRTTRQFLFAICSSLMLIIVYYILVHYVLQQPLPLQLDDKIADFFSSN